MSEANKSIYLRTFNEQLFAFVDDLEIVFPDNDTVSTMKSGLIALKKVNPKIIISTWQTSIVAPYSTKIDEGDFDFFIEKDYTDDLGDYKNSESILSSINEMRSSVRQLEESNKQKSLEYIKNLCKLSQIYHS